MTQCGNSRQYLKHLRLCAIPICLLNLLILGSGPRKMLLDIDHKAIWNAWRKQYAANYYGCHISPNFVMSMPLRRA